MCNELPKFKYSPNCYVLENEIFSYTKEGKICECCNEKTNYYYDQMMYSLEDTECICPNCISSGKAAKKFDGEFIQDSENSQIIDEIKRKELFERTPGYVSWQGEYWLECCNDYFNENVEMEMFKEYEVDKLVFFEADAFTYISIGISNENEGKIYYYDIEIADSLSEFLLRIQNDENYYLESI